MQVRVQAIDGAWETLGVDRYAGVWPENINPTYNPWGPDGLTFTLRRDPDFDQPDVTAFTPIELVDGEDILWDGFIIEAPGAGGDDASISIVAQGWQYELDDDLFAAPYVIDDLKGWSDVRSRSAASLTFWRQTGAVDVNERGISLTTPKGTTLVGAPGDPLGVCFDMGENLRAEAVYLEYETNKPATAADVEYRLAWSNAAYDDIATTQRFAQNTDTTYPLNGSLLKDLGGPFRFLVIYRQQGTGGPAVTPADDVFIQLQRIRIFAKAAYHDAQGRSALKADVPIKDALQRAPQLDPSTALIAAPSFVIPSYTFHEDPRTPREVIEGVNNYQAWVPQMKPRRRLSYQPPPSRAELKVRLGAGARWQDTSAASGRELYNKVIVRGKRGDGTPLEVERTTAHQPGAIFTKDGVPQPSNPGAEVDASGWAGQSGTSVTRDTGQAHTGAASIKVAAPAGSNSTFFTGPTISGLRPGSIYALQVWARRGPVTGDYPWGILRVEDLDAPGSSFAAHRGGVWLDLPASNIAAGYLELFPYPVQTVSTGAWALVTIPFTAPPGGRVRLNGELPAPAAGATAYWLDDHVAVRSVSTIADRRGKARAKAISVEPSADMLTLVALGDSWIGQHSTQPMKGTLVVTSDDAVTTLIGETPINARELGQHVNELIVLDGLVDPDTAEVGRIGKIVAVSGTDAATITIDNTRAGFEALLQRMAVVANA